MPTFTQEKLDKVTAILEQLDEQPLPIKNADRRHIPRLPIRTPLRATLLSGDTDHLPVAVDIFSRNISPAGMGFVCRRPFRIGDRVAISLIIGPLPPRLLLGRVTFTRYIKGGLHEMGAEFLACVADPSRTGRVPLPWMIASRSSNSVTEKVAASAPKQDPKPRAATGEGAPTTPSQTPAP